MGALGAIAAKLLPLYGVIVLGWLIGGRVPRLAKIFSALLVYGLIPLLVIDKVQQAEMTQIYVIPPLMFAVAALMSVPAHALAKRIGDDIDPRLLSASFSFFNVAFFGLPVTSALFGEAELSTIVCAYLGSALYGDTVGYFLIARGKVGARKAATQALRVPLVYAFVLAMVLKLNGVELPDAVTPVVSVVGVFVSVLGMAVIGLNLAEVERDDVKPAMLRQVLLVRQASAILLVGVALTLEAVLVGVLDARDRSIVGLVALFPIASNVTLFATLLDSNKRSAAVLVGVSSVVSLVLVFAAVAGFGDMLTGP